MGLICARWGLGGGGGGGVREDPIHQESKPRNSRDNLNPSWSVWPLGFWAFGFLRFNFPDMGLRV